MENKKEYKKEMFTDVPEDSLIIESHKEAIKQALDIRKFEIELYWKRATYFWTFIGGSFVAYFALMSSSNYGSLKKHIFLVSVIGFVFSYFWYFVNRGSKFWQNNWEKHVDYLEDLGIGSLYKIVVNPNDSKFIKLLSNYPFSVTKINQFLSLFISFVWLLMTHKAIKHAFNEISLWCNLSLCVLGVILITFLLYSFCRSSVAKDNKNKKGIFVKREIN